MSVLSRPEFHDEAKAFEHVEGILWPNGPVCPKCKSNERHYALKGVRSKASKKNPHGVERHGLYKCSNSKCRSQFTVRMGTIFEESHMPLHKWLQAIHLMCASKKGISAHQMHRILECKYDTAWFLCHRIRFAMASGNFSPLGGSGKIVEADETYIGRLAGTEVRAGGGAHKNTVFTLVERGGTARSFHIDSARMGQVMPIVRANVARETSMMTDESGIYRRLGGEYASHDYVKHSKDEYVRGTIHTNTVEGFYSIFKRGMKGVYQHCAEHHLHRYLAEFDFRYSNRVALGIDDGVRAVKALIGVKGKRLTFRGPARRPA